MPRPSSHCLSVAAGRHRPPRCRVPPLRAAVASETRERDGLRERPLEWWDHGASGRRGRTLMKARRDPLPRACRKCKSHRRGRRPTLIHAAGLHGTQDSDSGRHRKSQNGLLTCVRCKDATKGAQPATVLASDARVRRLLASDARNERERRTWGARPSRRIRPSRWLASAPGQRRASLTPPASP